METRPIPSHDLTAISSLLTAFAVLAGMGTCFAVPLTLMTGDSNWWIAGACGLFAFCMGLAAWALRQGKKWAFVFTGSFLLLLALVFPIGTLFAYMLSEPLWSCRHGFYPFAGRESAGGA